MHDTRQSARPTDLSMELPELDADAVCLDGPMVLGENVAWDAIELEAHELVPIDFSLQSPLPEGAIPPERVRFAAPVEVRVEGEDELVHGAVLNLSAKGVACSLPVELSAGQRVWLRFRLGLADEPLALLCVVIWRREPAPHDPLYGMQFSSLSDEERERIGCAVRERAEGRAAAWPLPLMPSAPHASTPRGPSTWLSAAAGMVAGIVLALLVSAVPNFGAAQPLAPVPVEAALVAVVPTQPEEELPALEPLKVIGPVNPAHAPEPPLVTAPPAKSMPTPTSLAAVSAAVDTAKSAPSVTATPTDATDAAEAKASEPSEGLLPRREAPATGARADALHPTGTARGVELALLTDGPVDTPAGFWLDNPRRYVIDVPGRKSGFAQAAYDVSHPLVQRLRIGEHGGKVRFVLEVAPGVRDAQVRAREHAVVVELAR